ncbi:MAG: DUF421 domain-containing protein [Alphaproteobacteria bacterium]|nr:DUF421 domain-containing protein [Alphaproteobacteria bacterium]
MNYTTIFDSIPWPYIGNSIIQTISIYILVLLGLKIAGRRVFSERSPQDLIILLLIAEACDLGLSDERAGYWGTIASVITILLLGSLCERISWLRHLIESKPIIIYQNGHLYQKVMQQHMIEEDDLEETARQYGLKSYKEFTKIVLETEGHITGILKSSPLRKNHTK